MVCCYTIVEWEYMNFKINSTLFHITPCIIPRVADPGIDIGFSGWYSVWYGKGYVYYINVYLIIYQTQIYFFLSYKGLLWIYIGQGRCYWYSRLVIAVWKKKTMFYYYVHVCNNKKMQWCFNIRYIKTQAEFNEKDCLIQGSE